MDGLAPVAMTEECSTISLGQSLKLPGTFDA